MQAAWMQTVIFIEWIKYWDPELRLEGHKILLLVYNFSSHSVNPDKPLTNIQLEFFAPNITSHVQPLDAGIIANFKCYHLLEFINYAIDCYELHTLIARSTKLLNSRLWNSLMRPGLRWEIQQLWIPGEILASCQLKSRRISREPKISCTCGRLQLGRNHWWPS